MTENQKLELSEFVKKWKNEIPEKDIYFSSSSTEAQMHQQNLLTQRSKLSGRPPEM